MSDLNRRVAEALGYELQTDPYGSGQRAWYLVNRDAEGIRDAEGRRLVLIAEERMDAWLAYCAQAGQGETEGAGDAG